jgi:hypothetical protein
VSIAVCVSMEEDAAPVGCCRFPRGRQGYSCRHWRTVVPPSWTSACVRSQARGTWTHWTTSALIPGCGKRRRACGRRWELRLAACGPRRRLRRCRDLDLSWGGSCWAVGLRVATVCRPVTPQFSRARGGRFDRRSTKMPPPLAVQPCWPQASRVCQRHSLLGSRWPARASRARRLQAASDPGSPKFDILALSNLCLDVVVPVDHLPDSSSDVRRQLLEELHARTFDPSAWELGGAMNGMVAGARLGLRVGAIGHVGDDEYGAFVHRELQVCGGPCLACQCMMRVWAAHRWCAACISPLRRLMPSCLQQRAGGAHRAHCFDPAGFRGAACSHEPDACMLRAGGEWGTRAQHPDKRVLGAPAAACAWRAVFSLM